MRNKAFTPVLLLFLAVFSSCNAQVTVSDSLYNVTLSALLEHNVTEVNVQNAYAVRNVVTFVDARESKEYETSHIQHALWVGYDQLNLNTIKKLDRNTPIIVYCSVGYRSEKVTQKIEALGFTNVSNLYGGIFEWVNEGHPIYNTLGMTKKIHAYNQTWGKWLKKGEKVY